MPMRHGENARRELILAGLHEIEHHGMRDFSLRRVAASCGLSCAAPYKHFKNKEELILEVLKYLKGIWREKLSDIVREHKGDLRRQIEEICISYIKFLVDMPAYRAIIMQSEEGMEEEQIRARATISSDSKEIIDRYCDMAQFSHETRLRKISMIRSILYGGSLMIANGELANSDDTYDMFRQIVSREFDIV